MGMLTTGHVCDTYIIPGRRELLMCGRVEGHDQLGRHVSGAFDYYMRKPTVRVEDDRAYCGESFFVVAIQMRKTS